MKLSTKTKSDFYDWAKRVCRPEALGEDGELLRPEWWDQALQDVHYGPTPGIFELGKFDSRTGRPEIFYYDWEED